MNGLSALPGGGLVAQGMDDLAAGRESIAALMVGQATRRLGELGLVVRAGLPADMDARLYSALQRADESAA